MNQMRQTKKAYEGLYNKYIKRGLDIIITGIVLVILWPLYLILAVAIFWKTDSQFLQSTKRRI